MPQYNYVKSTICCLPLNHVSQDLHSREEAEKYLYLLEVTGIICRHKGYIIKVSINILKDCHNFGKMYALEYKQLKILQEVIVMWSEESSTEYFKELVESAIRHQSVHTDEMVKFYIVNLLVNCIESEKFYEHDEPIAITLNKALQASFAEQAVIFRHIGDIALYISGFFSESLTRKLVDVDYYISIGRMSYSHLADLERAGRRTDPFSCVHQELSERFVIFTDILTEVSERCNLTSDKDILRLYERWIKTKSKWSARLLRNMGIEPLENLKYDTVN
ncbi:MAG: hypothetical protein ACE5IH_09990 [Thermodesulfobacteriota bacterium]